MQVAKELVAMGQKARDAGRLDEALACYLNAADMLQEARDMVAWAHALRHAAD